MISLKLCSPLIIYKNEHYKSLSVAEEPEKTNNESFDCFSRVSSTEKNNVATLYFIPRH